jgi:hypothetical protein
MLLDRVKWPIVGETAFTLIKPVEKIALID